MSEAPIPERQRSLPENPAVISHLAGVLSDDKRTVRVNIELSNGLTQPDLELILKSAEQLELSRTTIIENIGPRLSFTMHIRQQQVKFPLILACQLSYLTDSIYSEKEITVENK